jgi:hypothetical protein
VDTKDFDVILAAVVAAATGAGAFYVSLQELQVHQQQLSIERNKAVIEANDTVFRQQSEILQRQCEMARAIYGLDKRNSAISQRTSDELHKWAEKTLIECTR